MENNSWKIMREGTFSPRISPSSNLHKKKNIRKEFFPFMKDIEKINLILNYQVLNRRI